MKLLDWVLVVLSIVFTALVFASINAYADGPIAIIGRNGQITYVFPGEPGLPTAIIPPTGGVYHAIPMTPPEPRYTYRDYLVPDHVPQQAYVPPTYYVPPVYTPPSYGGGY